jgi:uncharacterized protein (TIGR01244 family)
MPLELTQLNADFATSGQLSPEDMAEVASLGFRAVIDNRPDGEAGAEQPPSDQLKAAAEQAGLQFVYQPVVGNEIDMDDAARFAAHLEALPGPVLAFCRSGARSQYLYRLATVVRAQS